VDSIRGSPETPQTPFRGSMILGTSTIVRGQSPAPSAMVYGKADRRWERRKRLPVDVFGQDRSENGLAWLVGSNHCGPPYRLRHFNPYQPA
jgi:hypothetical protein